MSNEQKLLTMKVTHFFLGTLRMKNTSIGYCYWIDAVIYYIKKYEKEEYIFGFYDFSFLCCSIFSNYAIRWT